jgi:hypothetical protein
MINMKKTLISAACAIGIVGCGGGSNFSAPPALSTTSGKVVDGAVSDAEVVCDSNGNDIKDAGEVSETTGPDGNFIFNPLCNAKLFATGGTNIDSASLFIGRMTAPRGSKIITPLTTLLATGFTNAQLVNALDLPAGTDVTQDDPLASGNFDLRKKGQMVQLLLQQSAETLGGEAGDTTPGTLNAIYLATARTLVATIKGNVKLIGTDGTVNAGLVNTIIAATVNNVKSSNDAALVTARAGLSSRNAVAIANAVSAGVTTLATSLLKADDVTALTKIVVVLEQKSFDKRKNLISIPNDQIQLNGNTYTLQNFSTGNGVVLATSVSPLNTVSFNYAIKGTPIPVNPNVQIVMTTRVSVGVELSDTGTKGQVLQFILDKADVSVINGKLAVSVPVDAKLYAYGKTSNGTMANVMLLNNTTSHFFSEFITVTSDTVAGDRLSFNAGNLLTKLGSQNAIFPRLQNISGTFNLKIVVSNLSLTGQTTTSVQGLSVSVTGTSQSMSGLGVKGKFTVQ